MLYLFPNCFKQIQALRTSQVLNSVRWCTKTRLVKDTTSVLMGKEPSTKKNKSLLATSSQIWSFYFIKVKLLKLGLWWKIRLFQELRPVVYVNLEALKSFPNLIDWKRWWHTLSLAILFLWLPMPLISEHHRIPQWNAPRIRETSPFGENPWVQRPKRKRSWRPRTERSKDVVHSGVQRSADRNSDFFNFLHLFPKCWLFLSQEGMIGLANESNPSLILVLKM